MSTSKLGRLERVELREAWQSEPADFTPWLAEEQNLKLLGETLGMSLQLEAVEKNVGPFSADILCKEPQTEQWVLIENQLEQTDHTHLGQIITYSAGLNAVSVIWIAAKFVEEHRAALDWLNEITTEATNFFGVEVELWRIGDSPFAPKFNLVSKPNAWSKQIAKATPYGAQWTRERFLTELGTKSTKSAEVAAEILAWAEEQMPSVSWGWGRVMGSFTPVLECGGEEHQVARIWSNDYVELQFDYMRRRPPFDDQAKRQDLADRFAALPGFTLASNAIDKLPSVGLDALHDVNVRRQFFDVLDWFVAEVKAHAGVEEGE